jgi:hypothetical protein
VAVFVYLVGYLLFADIRAIVRFVPDDAAYYFRISENIAAGKGSTFDGIHPTNGYQPLWLIFLIPISRVFHGPPEVMTRIYLIYQTIILLCAGWLFWLAHSKLFPGRVLLFNAVLFAFLVFYLSVNGMESGVLVLTLGLLYYTAYKLEVFARAGAGGTLLFGTLVGFAMLARLDVVFLGASIVGYCLLRASLRPQERRFWLSKSIHVFLGATIVCLPYLIYNLHYFGSYAPISAILKSSFPHPSFDIERLWRMARPPAAFGVLAFGYAIWALIGFFHGSGRNNFFRACLTILAVAVSLHFVNCVLFMKWGVFKWHFIPYSLFATFVISEPLARLLRGAKALEHKRLLLTAATLAFVGVSGGIVYKTWLVSYDKSFHVHAYTAALWAREKTQPSDVFAMKDTGTFGYFSERSVINLDGVVNNLAFQDVLRSGRLGAYLEDNGVKYLVQHELAVSDGNLLPRISRQTAGDSAKDYDTITLRYKSQKYGTHSDPIVLDRSNEVYRGKRWKGQTTFLPFTIWCLSGQDSTSVGHRQTKTRLSIGERGARIVLGTRSVRTRSQGPRSS